MFEKFVLHLYKQNYNNKNKKSLNTLNKMKNVKYDVFLNMGKYPHFIIMELGFNEGDFKTLLDFKHYKDPEYIRLYPILSYDDGLQTSHAMWTGIKSRKEVSIEDFREIFIKEGKGLEINEKVSDVMLGMDDGNLPPFGDYLITVQKRLTLSTSIDALQLLSIELEKRKEQQHSLGFEKRDTLTYMILKYGIKCKVAGLKSNKI